MFEGTVLSLLVLWYIYMLCSNLLLCILFFWLSYFLWQKFLKHTLSNLSEMEENTKSSQVHCFTIYCNKKQWKQFECWTRKKNQKSSVYEISQQSVHKDSLLKVKLIHVVCRRKTKNRCLLPFSIYYNV